MHARIATAPTRPEAAADVERVWRDLLRHYRGHEAFRGMVSLYDKVGDVAVTITLWTSESGADDAASALRPMAVEAFDGLLLGPPTIAAYDVLLAYVPAAD